MGTLDLTVKVSAADAGQRSGKMQIRLSDPAGKALLTRTEFYSPRRSRLCILRKNWQRK